MERQSHRIFKDENRMSKGFITGTNEELIKAYKESRDESYLKELIEANKGLINLLYPHI